MHIMRPLRLSSLAIAFVWLAAPQLIAAPPDPLRWIPSEATLVIKIEKPREFIEGVVKRDAYQSLRKFPQVRELLESTQVRRFLQIVSYMETELGAPWPELIDKLAGGGIALGAVIGAEPAPTVIVVQGTDEAATTKAYELFLAGIRDESNRDGTKQELVKATYREVPTVQAGKEVFLARIGAAIVFGNNQAGFHAALELATKAGANSVLTKSTLPAARKIAGKDPVAWAWLDFAKVKATPQGKDFFEATRKDVLQTVVVGSSIDAARRSDFLAFVLDQSPDGYALRLRMPAKRAELDKAMSVHAPMNGEPGSRPLLQPKGTIYSQSFYLDLGYLWKERKTMFNPENLKDIEKGIADIDKVLPGTTFGNLLEMSGPYHRIVSVQTGEKLYAIEPGQRIPPTAYVGSMRDKEYGRTMDGVLRAAALLGSFQTGWKMSETMHDGVKIVTYRFPENAEPKYDDPTKLRFNAAPSFAIVGDHLIVGSTPGIVKLLIPVLKKESKADGSSVVWRATGYAAGGAELLLANPEPTITQTILTQGIGLAEAKKQVEDFAAWLRTAGQLNLSIDHAKDWYELKLDWTFAH